MQVSQEQKKSILQCILPYTLFVFHVKGWKLAYSKQLKEIYTAIQSTHSEEPTVHTSDHFIPITSFH